MSIHAQEDSTQTTQAITIPLSSLSCAELLLRAATLQDVSEPCAPGCNFLPGLFGIKTRPPASHPPCGFLRCIKAQLMPIPIGLKLPTGYKEASAPYGTVDQSPLFFRGQRSRAKLFL